MIHKVFISYHHRLDQTYKDELVRMGKAHSIFVDWSVDTGDISDHLDDQSIRRKIRDEYLRSSTVTILLVGLETAKRKHVDWEIHSSMIDGQVNKKSGLLIINLPITGCTSFTAPHDGERELIYPEPWNSWTSLGDRFAYSERYPYMPPRVLDNLAKAEAKISVTPWSRIENNPRNLSHLIEFAFRDRASCKYALHRPMRRNNS